LGENMLRLATDHDFGFLRGFSTEPRDEHLRAQIRDGRLRIIESAGHPAGFVKFYVLWEILPFIEVIIVREELRGRGVGKEAVRSWESEMAGRYFARVLTSTRADETAKNFWRRLGYCDCGSLTLPGRPVELFFSRDLAGETG
jgi:ribosomal protein S18 acetylase RimI-like enzyme